jgi:hypothetical protein
MGDFLKKIPLVFHPLLVAIFPILFLYATNISESSVDQIYLPVLFSIAGSAVIWVLFGLLTKSILKGALVATIFLVFFYSYGRFYELLETWDIFVPSHAHLLPVFIFVFGYCAYFIKIAKRDFRNTTKILNIMALVLILINLGNIVFYHITKPVYSTEGVSQQNNQSATLIQNELGYMPDIYYIVLDEYAHPDTMKEYYNYDNSAFVNSLKDKGFFIASESRTKASHTYQSIASTLNMEYMDQSLDDSAAMKKVEDSRVANILHEYAYKYIFFGNRSTIFGGVKVNADVEYNFYGTEGSGTNITDFQRILWKTTMLAPFYDYLIQPTFNSSLRGGLVETINTLKKMPEVPGPKFIFAHILSPHEPFVFGPNGEVVDSSNWEEYADKQYYLGQYIYISKQIEEMVNTILDKSTKAPIIIIQSDHGIRLGTARRGLELGSNEWKKIFNAYYLPGDGSGLLDNNISPVNTFRIVFNYYFGTNYNLLENQ